MHATSAKKQTLRAPVGQPAACKDGGRRWRRRKRSSAATATPQSCCRRHYRAGCSAPLPGHVSGRESARSAASRWSCPSCACAGVCASAAASRSSPTNSPPRRGPLRSAMAQRHPRQARAVFCVQVGGACASSALAQPPAPACKSGSVRTNGRQADQSGCWPAAHPPGAGCCARGAVGDVGRRRRRAPPCMPAVCTWQHASCTDQRVMTILVSVCKSGREPARRPLPMLRQSTDMRC